jgi:DNA-binding CsgD family transcriptional regulator
MASQNELKKTARQYQIEDRRKQVAIMIAQGMSEVDIAAKLGVDNTTISKDVRALKLISQQFIYDITKSDFTYYYKQCLDMVRLILRKQWEIVDKERITKEDMDRAKVLVDIMNTVSTINGYYSAAPELHRSPMQKVLGENNFGVRPGTRIRTYKMTPEEEEAELRAWEEDDAAEEAELKALEEKYSISPKDLGNGHDSSSSQAKI